MERFGGNERASRDPRVPGNDHDSVADNPIRAIHLKVTGERADNYALAEPNVLVQDGPPHDRSPPYPNAIEKYGRLHDRTFLHRHVQRQN